MNVIVSKFGGSSMADADCFRRVRKIVESRSKRQYIILSAPGRRFFGDEKITDLLVRAHAMFSAGEDGNAALNIVRMRFSQIIRALNLPVCAEEFLSSLERDVRFSADLAASRGEYFCAKLFALYSGIPFADAERLILFDENGRIQRGEITRAVCAMAEKFPCAVIPGFYGSLPDGSIRTFTRGGSDITGALIAAALNADVYENWTDVDGLMSADPAVCPDAYSHFAVSYRQMRMLAAAGAQILHPYCVEPVCEAGIPTVLKNTFFPERPGTYISDSVRRKVSCVCAQHGYTAAARDQLNQEAGIIADALFPEVYSNGIIPLKCPKGSIPGKPAVIISAFGLPASQQNRAADMISPMGELHSEHCSKYIVSPEAAMYSQRALHSLISGGFTASRIL